MAAPLNWLREKLADLENQIETLERITDVLRDLINQELKEPDGDLMAIPARVASRGEIIR